jgi:hypothetical protein
MNDHPFHELFEASRKRAGLSHDQLAHRAWTSPGYTFRLCAGKAKPGRDIVIRLGVAMNLSVEEIDELLRAAGHLGLLDLDLAPAVESRR